MSIDGGSELLRLCHLAPDCEPEWDSITSAHHNALLEGPQATTRSALVLLVPYLSQPVVWRRPGEALELEADPCRTLIVEDVGALDRQEQSRLSGWLDGAGRRVQVLSTNTDALFSLVTRGGFDERLYYRLSIMLVQCRVLRGPSSGLAAADERRFGRKTLH